MCNTVYGIDVSKRKPTTYDRHREDGLIRWVIIIAIVMLQLNRSALSILAASNTVVFVTSENKAMNRG
jgi:hypothetical protein